jgi:hypothetical protein
MVDIPGLIKKLLYSPNIVTYEWHNVIIAFRVLDVVDSTIKVEIVDVKYDNSKGTLRWEDWKNGWATLLLRNVFDQRIQNYFPYLEFDVSCE